MLVEVAQTKQMAATCFYVVRLHAPSRVSNTTLKLLEEDRPEEPVRIVRTSGKEELVLLAVARCAATKLDAPESIDEDGLAQGVLHRVHELPRCEIEAIDRSRLCVVRDQECIAQRPEVRRSHSETPRLVQRPP